MEPETEQAIEHINERFSDHADHIKEWMDKRDIVLFGEDGRGGLVADVNSLKKTNRVLLWFISTVAAPVIADLVIRAKGLMAS